MYKNIAVIYGCDSSEWEVSCRSGEFVASRIDDTKYSVFEIFARFGTWQLVAYRKKESMRITFPEGARPEIDKNDFSISIYGEKINLDYAYIVQHGSPGENGLLQGYLDIVGIPYNTCSAFVSSVVFDKFSCKCFLKDSGLVKLSKDKLVRNGDNLKESCRNILADLSLPVFVKPTNGGSSFGITKVVESEELEDAIKFAFTEGETVIVEEGIIGRELTCAAYRDGENIVALPIIEILTENEYFDYDAKYNGNSQEVCPANIPEDWKEQIWETTKKIYKYLGCRGVVRIDYFYSDRGLYFLEVNTIPGMTSASLVPKMVREAGLNMRDFLSKIIENSK